MPIKHTIREPTVSDRIAVRFKTMMIGAGRVNRVDGQATIS
jgi:hypothetical protein